MKQIFSILFFLLIGCSSSQVMQTRETTVRDTTITVASPVIRDTLSSTTRPDSIIEATRIVEHDTTIVVRYIPKEKRFFVYVKPDSVRVVLHDTVEVVHNEIVKETPIYVEVAILLCIVFFLAILWKIIR